MLKLVTLAVLLLAVPYVSAITEEDTDCNANIPGCGNCSGSNTCIECIEGLNLYDDDHCFDFCPAGTFINSGVCEDCTGDCLTCETSATNCTYCMVGYYLVSVGNCQECDPRCNSCSGSTTNCEGDCKYHWSGASCNIPDTDECPIDDCLQCGYGLDQNYDLIQICQDCLDGDKGYNPYTQTCTTCLHNYCLGCAQNDDDTCNNCIEGRYWQETYSECESCYPTCNSCGDASDDCAGDCIDGYMGDDCSQEDPDYCDIENCLYCESQGVCEDCEDDFIVFQNGQSCQACEVYGCRECEADDPTMCKTCRDTYFKTESSQCQDCDYPCYNCSGSGDNCLDCFHGWSGTNCDVSTCEVDNCQYCSEELDYCHYCEDGFADFENQCQDCPWDNCNSCDGTDCNSCADGYYIDDDESETYQICHECAQTDNRWATCNKYGSLTCIVGWSGDDTGCQTRTNSCTVENCTTCVSGDDNTCQLCLVGYALKDGVCTDCAIDGCETCYGSPYFCVECIQGFYLMQHGDLQSCERCDSRCKTCIQDEDICSSQCENGWSGFDCVQPDTSICNVNNCLFCEDGDNATCETCFEGFYLSGSSCTACPQNCELCTSGSACTECSTGYEGATCSTRITCGNNCELCFSSLACLSCEQGYEDNGEGCEPLCNIEHCNICSTYYSCFSCASGYEGDQCTKKAAVEQKESSASYTTYSAMVLAIVIALLF